MRALQFLWVAYTAYRRAGQKGITYTTVTGLGGVPQIVVIVATGREAWRVSQVAIDVFARTI